MNNPGISALILHLILSAAFLLLMWRGVIKARAYMVPFVIFVPFWGCICALVLHRHLLGRDVATGEIPMEKLRIDDEIYRSLAPEVAVEKDVAPLEEVLMLAPQEARRGMMLDILNDAPERYTRVLLGARSGDDTEVVHYATTAMAEMSKKSHIEIQHFENVYSEKPDDPAVLREYSDYLEDCLKGGLSEGRTRQIQQNQLVKLLEKRVKTEQDPEIHARLIRQLIELKNYEKAQDEIARMKERWPLEEAPRLLEIECHALLGEGDQIRGCIREAREDGVYFSRRGEELIAFWA